MPARNIRKIALLGVGDAAWQGGIQYIINILNGLNAVANGAPIEVHLFRNAQQKFADLSRFNHIKIIERNSEEVFAGWTLTNRLKWVGQRLLQKRINPRIENLMLKENFDYVFPATLSDCNKKLNAASWIADFQYHHFPQGASEAVIATAKKEIGEITSSAHKIVLSSRYCEKDCLELFPQSAGKTYVMPFSVHINEQLLSFREFESTREKYSLPARFLMVANLFAPTKNHKTLFEALGILRNRGVRVNLICTGNIVDYRNQEFANEILQMLTENRIREQVHLLGLIPRADQLALVRMATAIVQPSINEGWSTSVEEGKALGKNIVLSDIGVHLEQYPDNPYVFKSLDSVDMADKIENLWIKEEHNRFPDLDKEASAFEEYQEKVREFGRRFLEIAGA